MRIVQWSVILAALLYALLFAYFSWSGGAAYLLAVLPVALAYMVSRTWLAAAFALLLPMYFVIGQMTAGDPHYLPEIALDRAMPLWPAWIAVYASLYVSGFLLPLIVVRGQELFHQTLKAYIFVMVISYAGFLVYPTIAPRAERIAVDDFTTWALQLVYDIDQPYGCFPSLHVAYSFVAALACYRMHRGVGLVACAWAGLIGISTVYTKQHFALDAVAGALIGLAAYPVFLHGRPRGGVADIERLRAPRRALHAVAAYAVLILVFRMAYQLGLGPVPD